MHRASSVTDLFRMIISVNALVFFCSDTLLLWYPGIQLCHQVVGRVINVHNLEQ